jgi:hypothetical protein
MSRPGANSMSSLATTFGYQQRGACRVGRPDRAHACVREIFGDSWRHRDGQPAHPHSEILLLKGDSCSRAARTSTPGRCTRLAHRLDDTTPASPLRRWNARLQQHVVGTAPAVLGHAGVNLFGGGVLAEARGRRLPSTRRRPLEAGSRARHAGIDSSGWAHVTPCP